MFKPTKAYLLKPTATMDMKYISDS